MGWRVGKAAVAIAVMFLMVSFAPMASSETTNEPTAPPTAGVFVNSVTTGNQINPRLFALDGGRIYVVWEEVQGSSSRIFFSMSVDDGKTFSPRQKVDDIGTSVKCLAKTPVVVVNSTGNIFIAWSDNRTGTYQIYFSQSDDGEHFSADMLVASTSTWMNQTLPDMAMENDNIFLAWSEYQPSFTNNTYIKFTYSTNSGTSFRAPFRLDTLVNVIQLYPSLSVRGSKVFVAWHDSRDNPLFNIFGAVSTNNGQTFPSSFKVSGNNNAVEHWYPTAEIMPDGHIFIAWQERVGGDFDIVGTVSTTNDHTFSTPYLIDESENDQSDPMSAIDPRGVISLTFRSSVDTTHRVMYTRSNDGEAFIEPLVVDNFPGSEQTAPAVSSVANGTTYMVFQDDRLGSEDVLFSKVINERPSVNILFPISGSVKDKLVNIAGDCSDPDTTPMLHVEVQLKEKGGVVVMPWTQALVANQALWNITINSTDFDNGDYEVWARSYDGALYSIEKFIDITFDNGIQPFVELSITTNDISFSPESPVHGEQVTITADVSNTGNTDAENVQVQFFRGGLSIGYSTIARVAAGTKASALFPWSALEGTFVFQVTVDPGNLFDEPNEDDNTATKSLTVDPAPVLKPDLEISAGNITISPSIVHVGELTNISAKVSNLGQIIATNVKVEFQIDGLYYTMKRTGQINPGEFYFVYVNWSATSQGGHSVTIIVDPLPREQDEDFRSNNQATKQFTVYAEDAFMPDLAISNSTVTISPVAPKIGQNLTFAVVVANMGDVMAEEVQVTFYVDGIMIGGPQLIPEIDAGSAADSSIMWLGALGTHTLTVKVDELDSIFEANESNNIVVRQFTVYPLQVVKPDLYVDAGNITISPDPPQKDRVLKFNVTIWNLGNDSASDVVVLMKIDGQQLDGNLSISYLAPGHSIVLTGMWLPSGGTHTFEVIVDPNDEVSEWSNANNSAQLQVELPEDPVEIPWLIILAIVAFGVLGYGIYSFTKARARKKEKK